MQEASESEEKAAPPPADPYGVDPMTWLERQVPGYPELTESERKAISDFCLLWSLFEAKCLNENANIPAMQQAVERLEPRLAPATELPRALKYFQERYVGADGAFTYRFEHLNFRPGDRRADVVAVLRGEAQEPASVLNALLIIIYRFRNNLFHGPKWRYGLREQEDNFRTANRLLMWLMDLHGIEN